MAIASKLSLLAFCLLCLALFSGAETALFSLSTSKVKTFRSDADRRKRMVADLLSQPRELLILLIILIIVMSVLVQNIVSSLVGDRSGWLLSVGVPLVLNLVLGEVIPKSLALPNNEALSYRVAPFLFFLQKLLFPLRKVLSFITSVVNKLFFFFLHKAEDISLEQLQHALKTSKETGVLHAEEAELIRGYLKLEESTVKELMRPRNEVIYYDINEPLSKLIHLFVDQECSRILVCRGGLDALEGIISSRLFFLQKGRIHTSADVVSILKKPFFVPEMMTAETLLKNMYEREESLAVVVDEYSSVSGIIAFEDLVEVVIGEIADRRDSAMLYTRSKSDVIIASGKLELSEFEEIFQISLHSPNNMVTIGGWLTEQLGDIPKTGTKYKTADFLFHVLASEPTKIKRLYIRKLLDKEKREAL